MTDLERLLLALTEAGVEFVVIGGVAMVLRGSSRVTMDLDVCYARDRENLRRLASALAPFRPRLRGAPAELPFLCDERTLASGLNFTLATDLGDVDIMGEVPGVGGFREVEAGVAPRCGRPARQSDGRRHTRAIEARSGPRQGPAGPRGARRDQATIPVI
jgi:hypothetical protein